MRSSSVIAALLLFLSPVVCGGTDADMPEYRFTHLTQANSSLCYDGISKVVQDSRGFIWIGTFSGLNRYDGTHFKLYRKQDLGLASDFVHTIIEDREGNLWVGTDAGVSRYLWKENRFEPLRDVSDKGSVVRNKVTYLHCGVDGKIWIVANYQGCFCYDPVDGSLKNYRDVEKHTPEYDTDELSISFRRLVEDGNGGFWVSKYHSNLFHVDSSFRHVSVVPTEPDRNFYNGDQIEQLFIQDGKLIVASNNHGLTRYDPADRSVETLFSLPDGTNLVDATMDKGRWIWLSTTRGVWRCDLQQEQPPLHLESNPMDRFSIAGDYVLTTCVDREGGVWIGSKDGGISYSGLSQQSFRKISSFPGGKLSSAVISGFSEDGKGGVWVSTEANGLFYYKLDTNTLTPFVPKGGKLPERICTVLYDNGKLWLGTLYGLYCIDASGRLRHYGMLRRSAGISDPRVYVIHKSGDGTLWFANTLGLFRYVPETDTIVQENAFNGVFITSMTETADGLMWLSSYATGLFVWNPVNGELVANYRYGDGSLLPSDKISSVFADSEGNIWTVGFSSGFAKLTDGRFTVFDKSTVPALTTGVFFHMAEDADGNLWLNSDKGLYRFNPENGTINLYTEFDGLLDNKLTNSLAVLSSGEILAGSDNGFIRFAPSSFLPMDTPPQVLISQMHVGGDIIGCNPDCQKRIKLGPHQNSFGFEFSVMNFSAHASNQLRCRLRGWSNDWQDVSVQKEVYYYNLPSGTYYLELQESVSGNSWINAHETVVISVSPTFFNSIPGISLVVLLILAAFAVALYFILRKQKKTLNQKAQEELFQEKMSFFSHVIHEIKTPLTLIKTPLQNVMTNDGLDEDTRHDLDVMKSNTDYLSLLVNELLEFVRIERNGYILNKQDIDLVDALSSIVFNYSDTAKGRNISINLSLKDAHLWVSADPAALNKILNNLLINALKFAETRIDIVLSATSDGMARLCVCNDGASIPPEFREDIFKPFVQYHDDGSRLHKGIGIGLPLARSLARKHSGDICLDSESKDTSFIFTIPLTSAPQSAAIESKAAEDVNEDSKPIILLVDDNAELREYMSRKLGDRYSVLLSSNGASALGIMKESNVDLLITDIAMPGIDGLELCRQVRADVEISHVSIIVLSARASVESKIQAMEAGADLYLEKPFDLAYLRSCMRNMLERRKLMRDAMVSGSFDADVSMFGLPRRDEEFLRTFDSFIKENLGNSELSNEMIADKLCISQSTLIRKIRKMLNTSPSNYIRTKRLIYAAAMLKDSHGNNITDICYASGFTNESYFAKCFKEQFGLTPSEYAAS